MPEPTARTALSDQLTEALTSERWGSKHEIGQHGTGHRYYAPCGICQGDVGAIVRLVLPVVEAALDEQTQRAEQAETAVQRVRALHTRHDCAQHAERRYVPTPCVNAGICSCGSAYPCETIAALDQPEGTP
ncbi:hypothetical protein OHR68_09865 [Spirillospora sp. NBC_00431]